jgi:hypothetical protein
LLIAVLLRFMDSFMIYSEPFVLTGGGPGNSTTFLSQTLARLAVGQFDRIVGDYRRRRVEGAQGRALFPGSLFGGEPFRVVQMTPTECQPGEVAGVANADVDCLASQLWSNKRLPSKQRKLPRSILRARNCHTNRQL